MNIREFIENSWHNNDPWSDLIRYRQYTIIIDLSIVCILWLLLLFVQYCNHELVFLFHLFRVLLIITSTVHCNIIIIITMHEFITDTLWVCFVCAIRTKTIAVKTSEKSTSCCILHVASTPSSIVCSYLLTIMLLCIIRCVSRMQSAWLTHMHRVHQPLFLLLLLPLLLLLLARRTPCCAVTARPSTHP